MGPGKADLLDAITQTGSISAAARAMGMSYRRAWMLVDTMNRCFISPLVETHPGGGQGAGARVTEDGAAALARYRALCDGLAGALAGEAVDGLETAIREAPLPPSSASGG